MKTLEVIDKKQNLMESAYSTEVTAELLNDVSFKEDSIAEALLKEFGLEEAGVTNPWSNDPAKSAAWSNLTPEDQKWLGQADPTDKFILARAPNKGRALTDQEKTGAAAAAMPDDVAKQMAAQTSAPTTAAPEAPAPVAPAAPATTAPSAATQWPTDKNAIVAFQKANGLTPDGLIGAKTMAALQKAGATPPAGFKPVGNKASGQGAQPASTAGAGRGGQGGPTAAQAASATANPAIAKIDAEIKRFTSNNNMNYEANKKYVAGKEAEKARLSTSNQAAQPAATTPAQDMAARAAAAGGAQFGVESMKSEDDAILERIRTALFR